MNSPFDFNNDGKVDISEQYVAYKIFEESNNESNNTSKMSTSGRGSNSSLQTGYNIVLVLVLGFIGVAAPILTILGLVIDPEYFFELKEYQFFLVLSIIELTALLVVICVRIKRSCEPDLSKCTTSEEKGELLDKAEQEMRKKYAKLIFVIIGIFVAIGLIAFLKLDISYRDAINEAITPEKNIYSFHFDTEKHPNYKDAEGWELYVKAKHLPSTENDFLSYEFKHTNSRQDKAIEELKNEIQKKQKEKAEALYHELVGEWYCPSSLSSDGNSITITIVRKDNTLHFNRDTLITKSSMHKTLGYEIELPYAYSFRLDYLNCDYTYDGKQYLKEKFDDGSENIFERKTDNDSETNTTTTRHYTTTTTKHYTTTTRHYTTKKHTTTKRDPYDVNDYYHADDFYYDHYDDFWDYEDAEDYYNEHHD